jgi:hypothetical protein
MEIDTEKIDEAVLALLCLTLHDGMRAWKGFDGDNLNRLYAKGLISDPATRAKSVVLTSEGLRASERLFNEFFAKLLEIGCRNTQAFHVTLPLGHQKSVLLSSKAKAFASRKSLRPASSGPTSKRHRANESSRFYPKWRDRDSPSRTSPSG